jgi:hypothetical protein
MADSDGIICTADEQLLAKSSNGTIVCLTRGQSIGLAFIAEAGFISMIAVVAIFTLIFVSNDLSLRDCSINYPPFVHSAKSA